MVDKVDVAYVKIWGQVVGAVSWQGNVHEGFAVFEFDRDFLRQGLDLSPILMGVDNSLRGDGIFSFRNRSKDPGLDTFNGLPGLLADCLPDKFGNAIIDTWLQRQGRDLHSFSPVERLCYTGSRGMGALEFSPSINTGLDDSVTVDVSRLIDLAQDAISQKNALDVTLGENPDDADDALLEILRVGTSAGGARAKAIIAINNDGHILSGQTNVPKGYDHWIIKFDGVSDLELGAPQGFGRIEYAYHLMAKEAGIIMPECRLLEENGRAHFMTRRFDRQPDNQKVHMLSLCGIAHYDFNIPGGYGYEQAFSIMRQLRISKPEAEQQFKRMVFNVISRNQDDHTKNIAFLMDKTGKWSLSPAYDITYAHNPGGKWTNSHQMTINGKRGDFTLTDLVTVGQSIQLRKPELIVREIADIISQWPRFAAEARINEEITTAIAGTHRLYLGTEQLHT
jgi:serine/threonine-protein kinase HipA